ncbi:ABC transporter substrate-binding protein [Limosilactobacillus sp. STM2_1]|uniref:ABC transporter substrate-binding protein n=1 Tax=Limosilactobacillus rudii TaxID=2759755 RepID=A0A7W3YN74_9LACO|nr:ABC transporter substrate-binding protein [Limosilactobacillus rudii]MBB1078905.1 ABC transporter substrate-binding protein [Limosilactobacillus rudii]MBB1098219.1 ABC transporter substrate-binding protein [Limosilactobacillus rudii]MCD7135666.1 ABC transporter substrate-binding protein [Limosilactobacillus rudii]
MKKKVLSGLLVLLLLLGITSPALASSTRQVKDMEGKEVKIPKKVNRVADLWHANNQVVLLLGGQKKLVATTPLVKRQHWFTVVDPGIKKVAAPLAGNQIQIEELIKTRPDVVITSDPAQLKTARDAKLPTVNAMYTDFAGLKKSVTLTANILGGDAPKVAREYNRELSANITKVKSNLKEIKHRPKVLHIVNAADVTKVDGQRTIVNEWITLAGGQNVIKKKGNQLSITAEEIIKANPDIIIVGSSTDKQARQALKRNKQLQQLKTVREDKVYGNPQGTFPWDRYSAEEALQILWAAKKIHPNEMKDVNMVKEVKDFYHKYYHYNLSTRQAQQILAGEN